MLDLEGNILLQIPPLDVSQDEDGDFLFSSNGEPVAVRPIYSIDATCVNDDLIFLSLNWYERKGNELDSTSNTELYYFVPSENKLILMVSRVCLYRKARRNAGFFLCPKTKREDK